MGSMDNRIRAAGRAGDLAYKARLLRRAGRALDSVLLSLRTGDLGMGAETALAAGMPFAYVLGVLRAKHAVMDARMLRLRQKRALWIGKRLRAAGVCAACNGRGWRMVHVHSGNAMIDDGHRSCGACRGAALPVRLPLQPLPRTSTWGDRAGVRAAAEKEADAIYGTLLAQATRAAEQASNAYEPLERVLAQAKGAQLRYENTRARAKFSAGKDGQPAPPRAGEKVPVGTVGTMFWESHQTDSVGLKTEDGEVFFTNRANLSNALNGWARLLASATAEQASQERAAVAAEEAGLLRRGQKLELDGRTLKVFWVGSCKRTGKLRFGAKLGKDGEPVWGLATEALAQAS